MVEDVAVSKASASLKVMVLSGGPDRERAVSLASGEQVAAALVEAGHDVRLRDIQPSDVSALDEFDAWGGEVIFPALHGRWGEGGGVQRLLEDRDFRYVGCGPAVAALCMDKHRTKLVLCDHDLPTPPFELVAIGQPSALVPPVVVKALDEGSSIDLVICHDAAAVQTGRHDLRQRHHRLLIEQFVPGRELTVGIVGSVHGYEALPAIEIIPAAAFYDYEAKYHRDDTRYNFDIDLPSATLAHIAEISLRAHHALGCRHLSRVDLMIDAAGKPWIIEVNTMPGFTTHSLLPMAARRAGLDMPALTDRLVRLACGETVN